VEDSIVTCARTRGSMMKFLPVAALTASAICVISASLKFGVMRCDCGAGGGGCAGASGTLTSTASAHTKTECKRVVTAMFPRNERTSRYWPPLGGSGDAAVGG